MLFGEINNSFDDRRLANSFNLHGYEILKGLYEQDKEKGTLSLKTSILKENIDKSNYDLLSTIRDLDHKQKHAKYYEKLLTLLLYHNLDEGTFQRGLEKINEKSDIRKEKGVYYTPEDVSSFILINSIKLSIGKDLESFDNETNLKYFTDNKTLSANELKEKIINFTILDPTCGTGAFLVKAFDLKLNLINKICGNTTTNDDILSIIKSLCGNDIDGFSTYITQTRLMFKAINFSTTLDLSKLLKLLTNNFYNYDFVSNYKDITSKFDLIIGNPPYVEKSKVPYKDKVKYGNIYADVVHNSFDLLKDKGVVGYIIPISYVSTPRFSGLRQFIQKNTSSQYVLSYADRPDCLFSGVHQKLNILIARKEKSKEHKVYTSDYNYWYKSQRRGLFDSVEVNNNKYISTAFYPKIGNVIEENIYSKITRHKNSIVSLIGGNKKLYLNMRATFWIKSFISAPYKSKEYKEYMFSDTEVHLMNVIFNSSLFWWFWVKVSDCWHITNKELSLFTIPDLLNIDCNKLKRISVSINEVLEKTKEEVNTKQTLYEYKHRKCKANIDMLDDFLAQMYDLSEDEVLYIKSYKENYRLGIES